MISLRANTPNFIPTISVPLPQRQHPKSTADDWAYHLGCTCPPCNRDGGSGSWIPGRGCVGEEVSTTTIIECQDQIATSFTVPVDQTTPTKMTPSEAPAAPEFTVQLQSEAREEQAIDRNGKVKIPLLDRLRMNTAAHGQISMITHNRSRRKSCKDRRKSSQKVAAETGGTKSDRDESVVV